MVTKKDFKAIAEIIKLKYSCDKCGNEDFDGGWDAVIKQIAAKLADYFATQNPRFDRQKFLNACGL